MGLSCKRALLKTTFAKETSTYIKSSHFHTVSHCITLHLTASHCITQHPATLKYCCKRLLKIHEVFVSSHCNILRHTCHEACQTCECVVSNLWMIHITHTAWSNENRRTWPISLKGGISLYILWRLIFFCFVFFLFFPSLDFRQNLQTSRTQI